MILVQLQDEPELTDKDVKVAILNEIQEDMFSIHKNLTSDLGIEGLWNLSLPFSQQEKR